MNQIEVLPPVSQARWGTSNTKVAACCLAYSFAQCQEQPYIRHANYHRPDKLYTSFWLEPEHPLGLPWQDPDLLTGGQRILTCQDFEVAWRHWDELVKRQGRYTNPPEWRLPLIYMRTGLDWRHWALKELITREAQDRQWTGIEQSEEWVCGRTGQKIYRPYKVQADANGFYLAVCLLAHGCGLRRFSNGVFEFNALDAEPLYQDYIATGKECRMQWHKVGMVRYDLLWADSQKVERNGGVENQPILWIRHGKNVALMPQNFTLRNKEALVKMLMVEF